MTLERIVYSLEEQLKLLGQQLIKTDPQGQLHEELARLDEEERNLQRGLGQWQLDLQEARKQINDMQIQSALLLSRIEALLKENQLPEAYQLAMELDQLRAQIPEASRRLPALEQTCWSMQFRIRQLRRQRDLVKAQIQQPR